jgi:hypothetical protein
VTSAVEIPRHHDPAILVARLSVAPRATISVPKRLLLLVMRGVLRCTYASPRTFSLPFGEMRSLAAVVLIQPPRLFADCMSPQVVIASR